LHKSSVRPSAKLTDHANLIALELLIDLSASITTSSSDRSSHSSLDGLNILVFDLAREILYLLSTIDRALDSCTASRLRRVHRAIPRITRIVGRLRVFYSRRDLSPQYRSQINQLLISLLGTFNLSFILLNERGIDQLLRPLSLPKKLFLLSDS